MAVQRLVIAATILVFAARPILGQNDQSEPRTWSSQNPIRQRPHSRLVPPMATSFTPYPKMPALFRRSSGQPARRNSDIEKWRDRSPVFGGFQRPLVAAVIRNSPHAG